MKSEERSTWENSVPNIGKLQGFKKQLQKDIPEDTKIKEGIENQEEKIKQLQEEIGEKRKKLESGHLNPGAKKTVKTAILKREKEIEELQNPPVLSRGTIGETTMEQKIETPTKKPLQKKIEYKPSKEESMGEAVIGLHNLIEELKGLKEEKAPKKELKTAEKGIDNRINKLKELGLSPGDIETELAKFEKESEGNIETPAKTQKEPSPKTVETKEEKREGKKEQASATTPKRSEEVLEAWQEDLGVQKESKTAPKRSEEVLEAWKEQLGEEPVGEKVIEEKEKGEKTIEDILNENRRNFAKVDFETDKKFKKIAKKLGRKDLLSGKQKREVRDWLDTQDTYLKSLADYRKHLLDKKRDGLTKEKLAQVKKGQPRKLTDIDKEIEKEMEEYAKEVVKETVVDEANKLYDDKTDIKIEAVPDKLLKESIKKNFLRTSNWYRKLPLRYKLLTSAGLVAGGVGAGALGGATGAALATGLVAGRWFQRGLGGAATAVGLEGLIQRSQEKKTRKVVEKKLGEEFGDDLLKAIEKGDRSLNKKLFKIEKKKNWEKNRRYMLAGTAGVLVGSGLMAKGLGNIMSGAGELWEKAKDHFGFIEEAPEKPLIIQPSLETPSEVAPVPEAETPKGLPVVPPVEGGIIPEGVPETGPESRFPPITSEKYHEGIGSERYHGVPGAEASPETTPEITPKETPAGEELREVPKEEWTTPQEIPKAGFEVGTPEPELRAEAMQGIDTKLANEMTAHQAEAAQRLFEEGQAGELAEAPKIQTWEIAGLGGRDSVWKMLAHQLEMRYGEEFTQNIDTARQTYILDALKDRIAEDPEKFGLTDVDKVSNGQRLDFSSLFEGDKAKEDLVKIFGLEGAGDPNLNTANIIQNNESIKEWVKIHPGEWLTTEKTEQILTGHDGVEVEVPIEAKLPEPGSPEFFDKVSELEDTEISGEAGMQTTQEAIFKTAENITIAQNVLENQDLSAEAQQVLVQDISGQKDFLETLQKGMYDKFYEEPTKVEELLPEKIIEQAQYNELLGKTFEALSGTEQEQINKLFIKHFSGDFSHFRSLSSELQGKYIGEVGKVIDSLKSGAETISNILHKTFKLRNLTELKMVQEIWLKFKPGSVAI